MPVASLTLPADVAGAADAETAAPVAARRVAEVAAPEVTRVAALALTRLRMTTVAICASLPAAAIYAVTRDSVAGVIAVAIAEALIATVAIMTWRGRVPAHRAPLLHLVVWSTVVTTVFVGVALYRDPTLLHITALLVVSYGSVQLDRRMLYAGFGLTIAGWLTVCLLADLPLSHDHALVLAAAFAIGHVVSRSSALFLADAEHHRAQTEAMRVVAEERSRQLETALAAATREIAERVRAEQEREQLRDQFLAAQKMEAIGTLAGGVAHDINNVLAGILSMAELCRDDAPPRTREDLDQIIASCQRGAALTRNLLAFSRRRPATQGPLRIDQVAQGVVALLERTLPKRIALATHLNDDAVVLGDADQLTQAVVNLCTNAVDAIVGSGRISLFTRRAELTPDAADALHLPPGRYAAIAVADDGAGMDDATRARMFEPFFTSKPLGKGTGLGLAMVYGTVEQHRGAIDVVSTPGAGTTVTLYLPVADVALPVEAPTRAPAPTPRRHRVLVVDDEAIIRSMTRRVLEKAGHEVVAVDGGDAALAAWRATPGFAVVVMDMSMPGMSGAQCFTALRALDPTARVLLVSGYTDDHDLRSCLASGAIGFLPKPYDRADLVAAIDAIVTGRPLPDVVTAGA